MNESERGIKYILALPLKYIKTTFLCDLFPYYAICRQQIKLSRLKIFMDKCYYLLVNIHEINTFVIKLIITSFGYEFSTV